ncbi:MAG: helix-turn-helix domain-containing protein [Burkholderiales bacterium]|nr:helix-turn-helix domain-containing protein [Burkholderiales bacterium]
MSNHASAWAWQQKTGSTTTKLVLVKLGDNSDDLGFSFPSVRLMANLCEVDERTVQRCIRRLEKLSLLSVLPRFVDGRQTSNGYQLACPPPSQPSGMRRGNLPPRGNPPPSGVPAVTPSPMSGASGGGGSNVTRTTNEPSDVNEPPPQPPVDEPLNRLEMPDGLNHYERHSAQARIKVLPPDVGQTILDELSARIENGEVRNPLRYLSTLIECAKAGTFAPDLAFRYREERERKKRLEERQKQQQVRVQQVRDNVSQGDPSLAGLPPKLREVAIKQMRQSKAHRPTSQDDKATP